MAMTLEEIRVDRTTREILATIPTVRDLDESIAHHRDTQLWLGPRATFIAARIDRMLDLRPLCVLWES